MPKLINCVAVALDGTWFTTRVNRDAFRNAHPHMPTFSVGERVTIWKEGLMCSGAKGTLKAFDRTAAGKIIAQVHWLEGAPPLRVSIDTLVRKAPKPFWMVIPFNPGYANQHNSFNSGARQVGISPAVTRFTTEEAAHAYIERERRSTGYNDYIVLESIALVTPQGVWRNE